MCGIAGILSSDNNNINRERLKAMTEAVAHRGPDGEAFWINEFGTVGFGHRRLSIIDLTEAAAQPMHYMGKYTIVYNGEIYNYIELKEELTRYGYQFVSKSDTEVILAAFDKWKYDCLDHFDGMFAFAIWDAAEQRLFAARDRFGEKPFYYTVNDHTLYFGSEMKALWAAGIPKVVNEKMLLNYITLGHLQSTQEKARTFFENIFSIAPAHYFVYTLSEKSFIHRRYWDINKNAEIKIHADEAISSFSTYLESSVKMRLRSDVELGTSLSGGLDSSSIAAIIDRQFPQHGPLKTFSAVFPGFKKDESRYVNTVINKFGFTNDTTTPTVDKLIADFEKVCYHQEEPFSSSSIFAQFSVYETAKNKGVKVLLDGQGADEILAGYEKYIHWHLQHLYTKGGSGMLNKEIKHIQDKNISFNWGIKNYLAAIFPSHTTVLLEKIESNKAFVHPDINKKFIQAVYGKELQGINKPIVTKLNDILYYNVMQLGLEELLRFADRNSMAHSVEVRLPFLQHKLVEFVFSLPSGYKIHEGWTKWILRKATEKMLPQEIVWRTDKIGYEPPQQQWMEDATMQEYLHEAKRKLHDIGILNKSALKKPIEAKPAHEADNFNWRYLSAAQIL